MKDCFGLHSAYAFRTNLYMRLNYWVVFCGGTALANPPALTGVDAPASASCEITSSAMTFTLSAVPAVVTNLKLIILASEGQSNGITSAYSKAAVFGNPQTPVTTAIKIKSDYDAKYSAPTEAKPKVFFKYFYVNTATGEKSGEMQLAGKLATD